MGSLVPGRLVRCISLCQTVFEAVAHLLSNTRAAEELYLSQPSVSIQIQKLELSIGLPLSESGQGLYPYRETYLLPWIALKGR